MDDDYDEFGNYIGPDLDSDSSSGADNDIVNHGGVHHSPMDVDNDIVNSVDDDDDGGVGSQAVVLHEDKNYYPAASEVYPEAEVLVGDEDTQALETPIIAPIKNKSFKIVESELPDTTFSFQYLAGLMDYPHMMRHIAFIGHLHHGKTSFVDMLVKQTHLKKWDPTKEVRYTDTRHDEQARAISIKCCPISLVLPSLVSGKHFLLNMLDTPGHVNFSDEQSAALRLVDGVVLVVDAVEGVMCQTSRSIHHAVEHGLPLILVINKVDRLILDLKLPPTDAYHKLHHTIEEVNGILLKAGSSQTLSPVHNNVLFASPQGSYCFSVLSFAHMYANRHDNVHARKFAKKLWGDWYLDHSTRKFQRISSSESGKRTFVEFILEPLYKVYSYTLGSEGEELKHVLNELGVKLRDQELRMDPKPLLQIVLSRFFGDSLAFVEAVITFVKDPVESAENKVRSTYTGDLNSICGKALLSADKSGPLMISVTKLFPRADCTAFDAFGRVFSGTVRVGDQVRVMGEGYTLDDDEDMSVCEVTKIWVYQARYRVEVNQVTAGNWALFEGIDASIRKTATVTHATGNEEAMIFRPLKFNTVSCVKVAIEPINPSELPKMLDGLRKISKSYPLVTTRAEESGERIVLGTGELYMDCVLHDLRRMYSEIEIKVADPVSTFCETVQDTSALKCFANSPNKENQLTMIAEPLSVEVANDIEREEVRLDMGTKEVASFFVDNYDWDLLAARSIWSFGPTNTGANVLIDDTLSHEVDKSLLYSVKNSIVQGFQWATREGPLCDEPMRNVKFKLLDVNIAAEPVHRGGGQIIPTSRRVAYSAFLLSNPRLMEPMYSVEIQAPPDCVEPLFKVISYRRGHVTSSVAKPGTPLYILHAYVPVIDSFGLETDIRTHTHGQAFCTSVFDHWEVVPGDPLDKEAVIVPLQPSSLDSLAREFMIKTRRRKGLSEDVSTHKFFENQMLLELAKMDADLQSYFDEGQNN